MRIGLPNLGLCRGVFGGFDPRALSVPLSLWLSSRTASSLVTDGANQFTIANSQFFNHSSTSALQFTTGDLTVMSWAKADSVAAANQPIAGKYDTNNKREYALWLNSAAPIFSITTNGINRTDVSIANITAGSWNMFLAERDSAAGKIRLAANNGTASETNFTGSIFNGTATFCIAGWSGTATTSFFGGTIDSTAVWSRVLTSAEKSWLYNSGNGRTYADIQSGQPSLLTGLLAWYDLDESTGNAADSSGNGNTLVASASRPTIAAGIAQGQAGDGDVIRQWSDLSGNGYHATQTTVSKKPILKANQLNGFPAVRFDGTDDAMTLASAINSLTNNISAISVFAVWKSANTAATQNVITFLNNTAATRVGMNKAASNREDFGGRRLDANSNQVITAADSPGTGYIITSGIIDYANSDAFLYRNGTLAASTTTFQTDGNTSATDSAGANIGAFAGSSNYLNGDIVELLVFRGKPTDAERQAIERWLGGLMGISVA